MDIVYIVLPSQWLTFLKRLESHEMGIDNTFLPSQQLTYLCIDPHKKGHLKYSPALPYQANGYSFYT